MSRSSMYYVSIIFINASTQTLSSSFRYSSNKDSLSMFPDTMVFWQINNKYHFRYRLTMIQSLTSYLDKNPIFSRSLSIKLHSSHLKIIFSRFQQFQVSKSQYAQATSLFTLQPKEERVRPSATMPKMCEEWNQLQLPWRYWHSTLKRPYLSGKSTPARNRSSAQHPL